MSVAVLSSLITFTWDVTIDWGLFRGADHTLRERLMFTNPVFYWVAIALDLVLRFLWTITLFPSVAQFFNGGSSPGVRLLLL
jgi:hypothetical protein